jgi:hypothetical protein
MGRIYIIIHETERRTNWSVKQPMQPHTGTRRKYLRGEGNCLAIVRNVGLLRGKLASPDVDGGWSDSVPALLCPSDITRAMKRRALSLHLSVVTTLFGHSLAQMYQESLSFYWQECATTMWTHMRMHPAQTIIPNSIYFFFVKKLYFLIKVSGENCR